MNSGVRIAKGDMVYGTGSWIFSKHDSEQYGIRDDQWDNTLGPYCNCCDYHR